MSIIKFGIFGDLHIQPFLRSRKDDYFQVCLDKLTQIFEENDIIIDNGDLFEYQIIPNMYLYQLIVLLLKYKNKKLISTIGNHPIYNYNISTLPKTSLGLLDQVGVIDIQKENIFSTLFSFNDIQIDILPIRFQDVVEQIKNGKFNVTKSNSKLKILLAHHAFECFEGSLTRELVENLGYDFIICAHDHKQYDEITLSSGTKILRSGSAVRDRTDDYMLIQKPSYYQFEYNTKTNEYLYRLKELNHLPSSEVFTEEAYNQINKKKKKFFKTLDEILGNCNDEINEEVSLSMKQVLKEHLNAPENVIKYIEIVYQNNGLVFK